MRVLGVLGKLLALVGLVVAASSCGDSSTESTVTGGSSSSSASTTSSTTTSSASSSGGGGGGPDSWRSASWGPPSCDVETAYGPAVGIPQIAWESCGAGCQRVAVDWFSGPSPVSAIHIREDGGEVGAIVRTDDHTIAVVWTLPSFEPVFAIRTALPCVVRPVVPTPDGYWSGVVNSSPILGVVGFFSRGQPEAGPEVVPGGQGIVTELVGDSSQVFLATGDENALVRWKRGEPSIDSFSVAGAKSPALTEGGGVVFLGGPTDGRRIYRWQDSQETPVVAWSSVGISVLGLAASSGEIMWLDGAGDAVPGYTNMMARWATDTGSLSPDAEHAVDGYSEIVADAQRIVKGSQAGIEAVARSDGAKTGFSVQLATRLSFLGLTLLSMDTEIWVESAETVYRFRL